MFFLYTLDIHNLNIIKQLMQITTSFKIENNFRQFFSQNQGKSNQQAKIPKAILNYSQMCKLFILINI